MTQHFFYFSPQTPGANRWTVDLGTDAIRLGDIPGWATAAENGDAASNGVAIDDPTGTAGYFGDAILGLKTFYVEEDYCAPYGADGVNGTRLWTGYIGQRRYRRGNQSPSTSLLTGAARRIDISLEDLNSLASFRIIGDPSGVRDAAHGNRPAETDVQRIQWLIGTVYLPVTNDAGWIDTSGPVNMDANDYTGASAADVVHDCATASGKDWWIGYWEATGTDSLWYAKSASSTAYTSLLSLTDDIADLTLLSNGEIDPASTVWPVMPDAELLRDPTFTYAGLYEPYDSGYVIAQNATTANTYAWRDGTAPNANVKTAAKANAIATRLLTQDSTEQDRITCRVQLPATLATGIKAGQRIQFRSLFMPGYDPARWMRVKRCTVAQDEETDQRYTLTLELTPNGQPIACSTALGAVQFDYAAHTGYSAMALSVTPPTDHAVVMLNVLAPVNNNTPSDSAITVTSGQTVIDHLDSGTPKVAMLVGSRDEASPSGSYSFGATYTRGCCSDSDSHWMDAVLTIKTAATTPVQHTMVNGGGTGSLSASLGATTVGNMVIAAVVIQHSYAIPLADTGWTTVAGPIAWGGGDNTNLTIFARCIDASSSPTYTFVQNGGGAFNGTVELLEWAIT